MGESASGRPGPRHNPRWPAAPPWHETRAEFESRVAEYRRREAILAQHDIHVVFREVNDAFQLRTDGRPGTHAADRRAAYLCDARGVPVSFGQASHAISYAWEHLLPPDARVAARPAGGPGGADTQRPAANGAHGTDPGG